MEAFFIYTSDFLVLNYRIIPWASFFKVSTQFNCILIYFVGYRKTFL